MQVNHRLRMLAAVATMLVWSGAGQAQDGVHDLTMPAQQYVHNAGSFMLAANETGVLLKKESGAAPAPQEPFEPPLLSGSNAHLVLGLATIVAAGLTGMTAPEECETSGCTRDVNGTHAQLAKATVALSAATITSGLLTHWDDFHLEDGFTDPDNLHVLLGVTGAALMAVATVNSAKVKTGEASHAGLAMAGAAGMIVAIKFTW